MIKVSSTFPTNKIIHFFEKVCTKENIEDSPFINSISELENERIAILNFLKQINKDKTDEYNEEILKITKESSIRQGLKQIHESRIYVDTVSINKIVENQLLEVFDRYLEISDINITDISSLKLNDHYTKDKVKLTYYFKEPIDEEYVPFYLSQNNPRTDPNTVMVPYMRFLYFVTLFDNIKQLFVFDESYGFKGFLSMRIRHGTFSNVLRSVFDKHKIVSSMEPNSLQYQNVKYWELKFAESNKHVELQNALKQFSEDIDKQIEEGLSWINVQSKENPSISAIFNFDFSYDEMLTIFHNKLGRLTDLSDFIYSVFKILYDRLEARLSLLRGKIANQLTPKLVGTIDELQNTIQKLNLRPQENSLIVEEIVSCRTEIQVVTSQINNWFKVSYNQYIEEFPIDMILKASLDYIDIINTNAVSKGNVRIDNSCHLRFNGKYFESFGDIFINLFDNIISKNKDLEEELEITIKIFIDGEKIHINVKNNLSKNILLTDLAAAVEEINRKVINYNDNSVVGFEKGSGYLKICKCISIGLNLKEYSIIPKFTANEFQVDIDFNIKNLII